MQANDQSTAEDLNSVSDNLSFESLLTARQGGETEPTESESEEQSEEPGDEEPETEEIEEQSEEAEDEEPSQEGESEIDLLNLTPEQIQELAKKGKSRLLQRIGELTAQKKSLEEQLASVPKQRVREISPDELPEFIAQLDTAEKIQAKYEELEKTLDTTDALLEEYSEYGMDDYITVDNREFTKKQLKQANRNAREAINKFLPAQARNLAKQEQLKQLETQYSEAARKEVPEIQDEESEIGKNFKSLISDPLIDRVKKSVPEIGFQIEYILAHAARSIYGKKSSKLPTGAGTKLKANPPASPVSSGAAKSGKNQGGRAQDAYKRFEASGSIEDLIAARAARFS